jgi:hypothetical protein
MDLNETVVLRIDNDRSELAQFLDCELMRVDFPAKMTMGQYWKQSTRGTYLLLTASKRQPRDGTSVHVNVLRDGQIEQATSFLLKQPLVAVQEVCGPPPVD